MWLLSFLPNWIFYVILLGGIIGLALNKYLPAYALPASAIAFIFGTFMCGSIYDNNQWVARVKEMEAKIAKAEEQSKEANVAIETKVEVVKTKIKEKQVLVKQFIDREIVKYDSQCVIPKEFIEAHNKAAEK